MDASEQTLEKHLPDRREEIVLGSEILVDRRRRVIDRLGKAAHGDAFLAIRREDCLRRINDGFAHLAAASVGRRIIFKGDFSVHACNLPHTHSL